MAQRSLIPFGFGSLIDPGSGGDPFRVLRREMDRLFDDTLRGFGAPTLAAQSGGQMMMPRMDVSESDNDICITVDLPGVSQNDVDVTLDDDVLTIRGERKVEQRQERQNQHVIERSFGSFQRSVRLPFAIEPDQVQASFENGVLTVTLPKTAAQQRSRRIEVRGGSGAQGGQQQIGQSGGGGQGSQGSQGGSGTRSGASQGEGGNDTIGTEEMQDSSMGSASRGGGQGAGQSGTGQGGTGQGGTGQGGTGQGVNAGDGTPGKTATQGNQAGSSSAGTGQARGGDQKLDAGDGTGAGASKQGSGAGTSRQGSGGR